MQTPKHSTPLLAALGLVALAAAGTACKEAQAKVKGVGDTMQAFIIKNCATGDRYCQVCAYGGQPTIMAVGDLDDEAFEKDLAKIQALVSANADKSLSAFALFGKIQDGKFTPLADEAAAEKKIAALAKKLELTFPVTFAPKTLTEKEAKDYTPFTEIYDIAKSRTLLLAQANNKIVYAAAAGDGEEAAYEGLTKAVGAL